MMSIRLTQAERLALWTTLLGVLHHLDHVLRVNHSGWPFLADVTPFTYSLTVYPAIAVLLAARGWPRIRAALAFVLFVFPTVSHVTLETPVDQYVTWAHRPDVNMLGVESPVLGGVAVGITVLLSGAALLMFVAFVREARSAAQSG